MIFTVEISDGKKGKKTQTYEGFNGAHCGSLKNSTVLAVVSHQGENDFWKLDSKNLELAIEELKRYYRAEWDHEADIMIFNRATV